MKDIAIGRGDQGHGEARHYLVGNNLGGLDGRVGRAAIYGVVVAVQD